MPVVVGMIQGMRTPRAKSREAMTTGTLRRLRMDVGERTPEEAPDEADDEGDGGHDRHGGAGLLGGQAEVVLDDVELVGVDHLVGDEHGEAAEERLPEVARAPGRGDEGAEHVAQRLGRGGLVGGGFLARPDQHGEQAGDAHEDAAEGEPGHRGAGFGDEAGADDGAERVADGGAHARPRDRRVTREHVG
jgi:hypothetical protein